jgi:hypothetical protein
MTCRNCGHPYGLHPYQYFCDGANCDCSGWGGGSVICRNCDHPQTSHPNLFLCHEGGCRCPGWVEQAAGT